MEIEKRRTVRALIFNPAQEILLMQVKGGPTQNENATFWCTLGGKIEKDETFEEALRRELKEEAGITHFVEAKYIAFGEHILNWSGSPIHLIESFYAVHVDSIDLAKTTLTEEENYLIKDYRWWPISELVRTKDLVFPRYLAKLAQGYLNSKHWLPQEIDLS